MHNNRDVLRRQDTLSFLRVYLTPVCHGFGFSAAHGIESDVILGGVVREEDNLMIYVESSKRSAKE